MNYIKRIVLMSLLCLSIICETSFGQPTIIVQPSPVPLPGVQLNLRILPLISSDRYIFPFAVESTPLILQFEISQRGRSHGLIIGPRIAQVRPSRMLSTIDVPLYGLQYTIYDQDDHQFFTDRVNLSGLNGPGLLEVSSGIYIPNTNKIKIKAKLYYKDMQSSNIHAEASNEANLEENIYTDLPQQMIKYSRYRDGYMRRHLLDSGRGLSWVYLKEYEHGKDRKELLYHSRVFKVTGDRTRVYVPWLYKCDSCDIPGFDNESDCSSNGGRWMKCGSSISSTSLSVYGGHENPLLRGGIAMATFALEYLSTSKQESLDQALILFDYIQNSEWTLPNGTRSGFFLRNPKPGANCQDTGREYCYASIDEITGMTLGLYYLNQALIQASNDPNYRAYATEMRSRLIALVERLGTQLRGNYFFIIPPVGLPQERQTGWSGGYVFQWYLNGGFRAITGRSFKPSGGILEVDSDAWRRIKELPWNGSGNDEKDAVETLVDLEQSAAQRAIYAIQAIGFQMYYGGRDFTIQAGPIPATVTIPVPSFKHWNFSMLLHMFQTGMADARNRDPDTVDDIRREMKRLIKGVLFPEVSMTSIDLDDLIAGYLGLDWAPIYLEYEVAVGARDADPHLYAAAIACQYDLFTDPTTRARLNDLLLNLFKTFQPSLPIGASRDALPEQFDHNPNDKLGRAFVWEQAPGNRIQEGCGLGLSNTKVQSLYNRGYDAVCEGGGLGYLLPFNILEGRGVIEYGTFPVVPKLGACFTMPRLTAVSTPQSDTECNFNFPSISSDSFEAGEGNDSYANAKKIDWGLTNNLSIDRATHPNYFFNQSGVIYAKYIDNRSNRSYYITPEQDYDYYYLTNEDKYGVRVLVESTNSPIIAIVDGEEANTVAGDHRKKSLSVQVGKNHHVIMVTSPNVTTLYKITLTSLPVAEDQSMTTQRNARIAIVLTGRDKEGDSLTFTLLTNPEHGTLSGTAPNLIYTASPDYTGIDKFTFKVNDGSYDSNVATVSITVSS